MRKLFQRLLLIVATFLIVPSGPYRVSDLHVNHPTPPIVYADDATTTPPIEEEAFIEEGVTLPNTNIPGGIYGEPIIEPEVFNYTWVLLIPPVLICSLCVAIVYLNKKRQEN